MQLDSPSQDFSFYYSLGLINSLRLYSVGRPIAGLNPEDFQVEKDVEKLCTHVCINYFADCKPTVLHVESPSPVSPFSAKGEAVNHGPKILPGNPGTSLLNYSTPHI